ncbi:MAG: hypothetical protein IJS61_03290 [Firmicutes bacterium]|nr:hypothetical protein [Bacillota bacterium]
MKKTITKFAAAVITVSATLALTAALPFSTVFAAENISYIDENGNAKSTDATDISDVEYDKDDNEEAVEGEITLESGVYYVNGEVSLKKITVKDNVDIILTDNSTLNVPSISCDMSNMFSGGGEEGNPGFDPDSFKDMDPEDMMSMFGNMKFLSGNLSIYGQEEQSGQLIMMKDENTETEGSGSGMSFGSGIGITCDEVNINGGTINIDDGKEDSEQEQTQTFNMGMSELMTSRFIVNSGKVTLKCKVAPFSMSAMMEMFGGSEGSEGSGSSTGMEDMLSMFGDSSDNYVSLGCRTSDDFIFVKECAENVRIASGQILQDQAGNTYTGVLTEEEMEGIKNATLTLPETTKYTINISNGEHGSVEAPAKAIEGSVVILTVTPDYGYIVDNITVADSDLAENDGLYTFTMPANDVTVTSAFKKSVSSTYTKLLKKISSCVDVEEQITYVIFTFAPESDKKISDYDYIMVYDPESLDKFAPTEINGDYVDENGKIYYVYKKIVFNDDESDFIEAPEDKYYVAIALDGIIELDQDLFAMKAVPFKTEK